MIMPFQKGYDGLQGGVKKLWAGFTELGDLREELQKTREKLHDYESIADDVGEISRENEKLRKLLEFKSRVEYDSIAASIISKDPDNWFRTLVINRGSNDGIKVNMPVIGYHAGQKAVVGKISEVKGSVSRIVPIISTDIKIGVKLQKSGYPGLLRGYSQNSESCIVDFISRSANIKFNDIIVTSGQGGVFPPGLFVGKIKKIVAMESSAYQSALVSPILDYSLIDKVFVIKKEENSELIELLRDEK